MVDDKSLKRDLVEYSRSLGIRKVKSVSLESLKDAEALYEGARGILPSRPPTGQVLAIRACSTVSSGALWSLIAMTQEARADSHPPGLRFCAARGLCYTALSANAN